MIPLLRCNVILTQCQDLWYSIYTIVGLGKTFFIYSKEILMQDSITLSCIRHVYFLCIQFITTAKKLTFHFSFSQEKTKINYRTNDTANNREVESYEDLLYFQKHTSIHI